MQPFVDKRLGLNPCHHQAVPADAAFVRPHRLAHVALRRSSPLPFGRRPRAASDTMALAAAGITDATLEPAATRPRSPRTARGRRHVEHRAEQPAQVAQRRSCLLVVVGQATGHLRAGRPVITARGLDTWRISSTFVRPGCRQRRLRPRRRCSVCNGLQRDGDRGANGGTGRKGDTKNARQSPRGTDGVGSDRSTREGWVVRFHPRPPTSVCLSHRRCPPKRFFYDSERLRSHSAVHEPDME